MRKCKTPTCQVSVEGRASYCRECAHQRALAGQRRYDARKRNAPPSEKIDRYIYASRIKECDGCQYQSIKGFCQYTLIEGKCRSMICKAGKDCTVKVIGERLRTKDEY